MSTGMSARVRPGGRAYIAILLSLLMCALAVAGCEKRVMKKKSTEFPHMYQELPHTIVVLPPINETTAADAKDYYSTTIAVPLSLQGFYVFPIEVTADIMKMEGLYDSELLVGVPLHKFRDYFGADAVLFSTIKRWDKTYAVVSATLTVSVHFVLKSTSTMNTLWEYTGTVVVDLSGGGSSGGGLAGILAQVVVTAISTATTDYVPAARRANFFALSTIPYGRYHPRHNRDQNDEVVDQTLDDGGTGQQIGEEKKSGNGGGK